MEQLTHQVVLTRLRRLALFHFKCSTGSLATANRSEQRKQLFVKRVKVQTKKLFRILLLAILYTLYQHKSVTGGRYVGTGTYE